MAKSWKGWHLGLSEGTMGNKSTRVNRGSGHEELSCTDEDNETHRCYLISPSNKWIRTQHLTDPTIHPHTRSDVWDGKKMKIALENVYDNSVCVLGPYCTSLCIYHHNLNRGKSNRRQTTKKIQLPVLTSFWSFALSFKELIFSMTLGLK